MISEAHKRVQLYLEAAAGKPKPKTVRAKKPGAFHDKLDQKLSIIAKKFGVKLTLQRNKTKLPSITVSGLKALTFDKVVQLFNEIPNTSHIPQKIGSNVAIFRIFGTPGSKKTVTASDEHMDPKEKKQLIERTKKALVDTHKKYKEAKNPQDKDHFKRVRKSLYDNLKMFKMTANDDPQFVITAKKNGKRVYWNGEDFTALTAKEADHLDEESADKIERRLKDKDGYTEVKSVPATMTADESDENANADSEDASEDTDDGEGEDNYEGTDDAEDDKNKADIVKYITDNKISKDSLSDLIDQASASYTDSLKTEAPIEDIVDFIYDMLDPDETKQALKVLANKSGNGDA